MTTYQMSLEEAIEILSEEMSKPDWRFRLPDIRGGGYKGYGFPQAYSATTESGKRSRAAYRIQQEMNNPWKYFGKRGSYEKWENKHKERLL